MSVDRRSFIKRAGLGLAVTGISGVGAVDPTGQGAQDPGECRQLSRQGPKAVVRGKRAVAKPWKSLVAPAIPWAENGFPVDEFTRAVLEFELDGNTYFPAMRQLYAPTGFTPSVGEKLRNPALAKTLRRLADEGPEYFT